MRPEGAEGEALLNLTATLIEMIDLRSFSNLWFWILLAAVWTVAAHRVLGVPSDLIRRARRGGGQAGADLRDMLRINARRVVAGADRAGPVLPGLTFFGLTVLALLGFAYRIEFAQAVLLLAAPLSLVMALSIRLARRLTPLPDNDAALHAMLARHRAACQGIGTVAIFVTAMWGMWVNLSAGLLGY